MDALHVYALLNNKIKKISGGGSSTPITVTSNITVGAIPAGSKIVSKTSDELWKWALVQALAPQITFTSSESETIVREKGTVVNTTLDVKITVKSNGGSDIVSVTYYSTPTHTLFNGAQTVTNVNTFTDTIPNVTFSDDQEFKVSCTDKNGKTANSTKKFVFVYPMYSGLIDYGTTITDTIVQGGSKMTATKADKTCTFNSGGAYKVPFFAYPSSYGNLSKIMDVVNGFDLISNYSTTTVSLTGLDGTAQSYTVYYANIYGVFDNFDIKFMF